MLMCDKSSLSSVVNLQKLSIHMTRCVDQFICLVAVDRRMEPRLFPV